MHLVVKPGAFVGRAILTHLSTLTVLLSIFPLAVVVAQAIWLLAEAVPLSTLRRHLTDKYGARLENHGANPLLRLRNELTDLPRQTVHFYAVTWRLPRAYCVGHNAPIIEGFVRSCKLAVQTRDFLLVPPVELAQFREERLTVDFLVLGNRLFLRKLLLLIWTQRIKTM